MRSTYTVSALALLGVFAAGYALGWITSLIRGLNSAALTIPERLACHPSPKMTSTPVRSVVLRSIFGKSARRSRRWSSLAGSALGSACEVGLRASVCNREIESLIGQVAQAVHKIQSVDYG
jgi:hypothetical protein